MAQANDMKEFRGRNVSVRSLNSYDAYTSINTKDNDGSKCCENGTRL